MSHLDLPPRPSDRSLLADWYRAALERQAQSGIPMTAFADAIGVSAANLYLWRRRLGAGSERPATTRASASSGQGLLELRLADSGLQSTCSFTLRIGARFEVDIPKRFDADDLRRCAPPRIHARGVT